MSYLTFDKESKEGVLIDPSEEINTDEYLNSLKDKKINLLYIIETHTHADHISSCLDIKEKTGAKIIRSKDAPSRKADIYVKGGEEFFLGKERLLILSTPGHTNESISIYNGKEVFTGDTLLIGGTGRTDFQIGSSDDLYDSIHEKISDLPHETIVRPGHNYKGLNQSVLSDELHKSERLSLCRDSFVNYMDSYNPPKPELFDIALEKNSK